MNKIEFLSQLEKELKKHNVSDITEIIDDYREYFDQQLSIGQKEDSIASYIGDIQSIVDDYVMIDKGNHKKWFELVTVSVIALPLLILSYGVLIVTAASAVAFWAIAIYYLFNVSSFSFMPLIPLVPRFFYIACSLSAAVLMFSFSVRYYGMLNSMTKQYIVKQTIRIGEYAIPSVYQKILKISAISFVILFIASFIVSVISAGTLQYWHEWHWFDR
jgi:uncharacterized membrane protein